MKIKTLTLLTCLVTNCFANSYNVCFTPGEDCTSKIVSTISHSQKTILVQAFSFTSSPIIASLIAAHARGIDVKIILDKTDEFTVGKIFSKVGIPTYIDDKVEIAHNKVMIIDNDTIITGSFNFTYNAQFHNAENLLIIHDPELQSLYVDNWNKRLNQSRQEK
jgi:phosphatidylserine/phosphatidylglycerophosphate/cardiolipin synthase-like enzyme